MKTTHTPGPWNISKLATPDYAPEFGIYAEGERNDLARVINENSEANAMLIHAAPKMLRLCERACLALEEDLFPTLRQELRDVIAEATGEQP